MFSWQTQAGNCSFVTLLQLIAMHAIKSELLGKHPSEGMNIKPLQPTCDQLLLFFQLASALSISQDETWGYQSMSNRHRPRSFNVSRSWGAITLLMLMTTEFTLHEMSSSSQQIRSQRQFYSVVCIAHASLVSFEADKQKEHLVNTDLYQLQSVRKL